MPIPDFQTLMLPLLKYTGDKQKHSFKDTEPFLAHQFNLTSQEKRESLRSGQKKFYSRVNAAKTHLEKAGLLKSPKRGIFVITQKGLKVLEKKPEFINTKFLEKYDGYCKFRSLGKNNQVKNNSISHIEKETPEEALENAHQQLQEALAIEILENIKQCSPNFFESLVVDLLVSMGYGGSRKEAGQALKRSRDEGIDGIIKEDRLGLDIIYLQAKRWENVVGRPEIQKFAGALQGQRARKGIFITTSDFTKDAIEYISKIEPKIILLNGKRLTELMIEHNVGVTPIAKYEVKRIDSDYFVES